MRPSEPGGTPGVVEIGTPVWDWRLYGIWVWSNWSGTASPAQTAAVWHNSASNAAGGPTNFQRALWFELI